MNLFPVTWQVSLETTIVTALAILIGVLVHEGGHAIAAKLSGVEVGEITVSWWGGATSLGPSTFGSSLLIALSGPAANGVYAAALLFIFLLFKGPDAFSIGLYLGAWTNAFLTIFNLLPFSPLDGSHALSDLIAMATKSRQKGERVVAWIGISVIPLIFAWFIIQGKLNHWSDILVLVLVVGMIWKFSFDKLKQVDASAKAGNLAGLICNPVEFAEKGLPCKLVSGMQDVVVLQQGKAVGFVPAHLVSTTREVSPELTVEQLSSPIASQKIPADINALDLSEFGQGHFLVEALHENPETKSPTWLVERQGQIIGLIHHDQHLAHITG